MRQTFCKAINVCIELNKSWFEIITGWSSKVTGIQIVYSKTKVKQGVKKIESDAIELI